MYRALNKSVWVVGLLLALAAPAIAGCTVYGGGGGTGNGAPNTITMGGGSFEGNTNISITAGQAVTFDDPSSSGGTHHLVTGTSGNFSAEAGAPSEFATSAGINFSPGDSKTITFPTAGTYHITCTIHPPMQATITVS
jgi:plastocyanin